MAKGRCNGWNFLECFVLVLHIVFLLAGLTLLSLGGLLNFHVTYFLPLVFEEFGPEQWSYCTIVIGLVVSINATLGGCGVWTGNRRLLFTNATLLLPLAAGSIALGYFIHTGSSDSSIEYEIRRKTSILFGASRAHFLSLEETLKCCGSYGYQAYQSDLLPPSCCDYPPCFSGNRDMMHDGCAPKFLATMNIYTYLIMCLLFATAVLEILTMVPACCVLRFIDKQTTYAQEKEDKPVPLIEHKPFPLIEHIETRTQRNQNRRPSKREPRSTKYYVTDM